MLHDSQKGFTLIETVIGAAIFVVIASAIYFSYSNILDILVATQLNSVAISLLDNELEVVRNIPYQDVGLVGGIPSGTITPERIVSHNGINFVIKTTVRNVDDIFDGVIGGAPNDTAPADYKVVELEVSCPSCQRFIPAVVTTTVAPRNLENSSNRGALFVNVFNASGQPISGATVKVVNLSVTPAINLTDITNTSGVLQLVDVPTSSFGYQIIASRSGYSSERTYQPGASPNPNPIKPHSTVAQQQVTIISFAIDKVSNLSVRTQDMFCQAVPSIDYTLTGAKLIGTAPDVFKYSAGHTTDSAGNKSINNLEWDTYSLANTDTQYDIGGIDKRFPLVLNPDTSVSTNWLATLKNGNSLLVTAIRQGTNEPIDEAKVTLTRTGFGQEETTKRRFVVQTDWSGGQSGAQSGNIETANPIGELRLELIGGKYPSMSQEWVDSTTIDFGAGDTNFHRLFWNPDTQPAQTGPASLKFQIATNNDNTSWNFVGPDGTAGSFYTASGSQIFSGHNNQRYLRYRAYLRTEDHNFTPILNDLAIEFSSSCIIGGQVFYQSLTTGSYTLTIQKSGYASYSVPVTINNGWQEHRAVLVPQ